MERTLIILADKPCAEYNNDMDKLKTAGLLDILTEAGRLAECEPEMSFVIYHNAEDKDDFLNSFYQALENAEFTISRYFRKYLEQRMVYKKQAKGNMQEVVYNAFTTEINDEDTDKVVLINCSCPMLLGELIDDAFYYIDYFHLTLGGTKNGGFYLLAADQLSEDFFRGIDWESQDTYKEILAKAESMELSTKKLDILNTIETKADMEMLYPKLCENRIADNSRAIIKKILNI